jgi:alkanesulfonate monooxygenase SsuD/methylene tetrahydromethanopterin reductase-like flavin-dependent oxidoreductase (luciferase family)
MSGQASTGGVAVTSPDPRGDGVRFGLSLPNRGVLFGLSVDTLLEAAKRADHDPLVDSVWVGDNLTSKPRLEALVLLSALAALTERVRLGTICLASFPLRHPVILALQWASLDLLSNGRTVLAVCIGGSANMGALFKTELEALGVGSDERVPRLEEGIGLIRRLWSEPTVTHRGRFYSLEEITALPKPVQPRVPILIAVNPPPDAKPALVERALRRVALLGDGWQSDGTAPNVFRDRWQAIHEYAAEYGREHELNESVIHLMVNINEDVRTARHEALEFLDHYYGVTGDVTDEKMSNWLAIGPPNQIADRIAEYVEAGCTTPVLRLVSPRQLEQLDRLLSEVLPQFAPATR